MLYEFIKRIYKSPPKKNRDVLSSSLWIYHHHFCVGNASFRKQTDKFTKEQEAAIVPNLLTACKTLTTPLVIKDYQWHGKKLHVQHEGINLRLNEDQYKQSVKNLKVRLPHYSFGADGWLRVEHGLDMTTANTNYARYYVMLTRKAAPEFVLAMVKHLKKSPLKFRFKVATHNLFYQLRQDSCVMYFKKKDGAKIFRILKPLVATMPQQRVICKRAMPLTLIKAPGLCYADNPNTGESFGMHRSHLVARAFVNSISDFTLDNFYQQARDVFVSEGYDPDKPWTVLRTN